MSKPNQSTAFGQYKRFCCQQFTLPVGRFSHEFGWPCATCSWKWSARSFINAFFIVNLINPVLSNQLKLKKSFFPTFLPSSFLISSSYFQKQKWTARREVFHISPVPMSTQPPYGQHFLLQRHIATDRPPLRVAITVYTLWIWHIYDRNSLL